MEDADFSGWGSRSNVKCTDGRTILSHAFKHQDKQKVPLVWQHQHNSIDNVLGHAFLEDRALGTYIYGFLDKSTPQGKKAKAAIQHGDLDSLSIFANRLQQRGGDVMHGNIIEVSLVMVGANPEAYIEHVNMAHSAEGVPEEEVIIYTGLELEHETPGENMPTNDQLAHADSQTTVADIWNGMTEEQRLVSQYVVGAMEEENASLEHSENTNNEPVIGAVAFDEDKILQHMDDTITNKIKEGFTDMHNLFAQASAGGTATEETTLSHSQLATIFADADKQGSLKESFLAHAQEYGIENIDILFPDAKTITDRPDFIKRRTEWVDVFLSGVTKRPFSRIKSIVADITADEARARGYVKATLKKEEVIKLLKRVTTPTTIYKKQKLDRDDIVDITSLDVVAWLKAEMRIMLDEEIARACLLGDGREPEDEDKIDEEKIRPIAWDADMYAHSVEVQASTTPGEIVESILRARKHYKGSGNPTLFTTDDIITDLMLDKDKVGRRYYNTEAELAAALRVSRIVAVEVMESSPELLGILVNLTDYTIGADQGGNVAMFDDFDIDYNQYKYLIETRISGALTKPKSAVVIKQTVGTRVTPVRPTYDANSRTISIPNTTGVDYKINGVTQTGDVVITESTTVDAFPKSGYSFPHNVTTSFEYVVAE